MVYFTTFILQKSRLVRGFGRREEFHVLYSKSSYGSIRNLHVKVHWEESNI